MRKIILIAAMALTSAIAQAGETRSLSTAAAPSDAPATIQTKQLQAQNDAPVATPAKPADTPRYSLPPSETQTPADPARNVSDAPRYTARPAPVDNAPPTTASTAPSTVTPSTAPPERRYDDRGYYDDAGYHPFPRRHTHADRYAERPHGYTDRPYHRARWNARRIIAELHRYGIYW
jgi:hypothetical protein